MNNINQPQPHTNPLPPCMTSRLPHPSSHFGVASFSVNVALRLRTSVLPGASSTVLKHFFLLLARHPTSQHHPHHHPTPLFYATHWHTHRLFMRERFIYIHIYMTHTFRLAWHHIELAIGICNLLVASSYMHDHTIPASNSKVKSKC